ncbi:hypothetical protein [Pseudaminobacter soli (ex Li et al. 2025)]|nr:hypothetical protein [Mesorhizobium soli]
MILRQFLHAEHQAFRIDCEADCVGLPPALAEAGKLRADYSGRADRVG